MRDKNSGGSCVPIKAVQNSLIKFILSLQPVDLIELNILSVQSRSNPFVPDFGFCGYICGYFKVFRHAQISFRH